MYPVAPLGNDTSYEPMQEAESPSPPATPQRSLFEDTGVPAPGQHPDTMSAESSSLHATVGSFDPIPTAPPDHNQQALSSPEPLASRRKDSEPASPPAGNDEEGLFGPSPPSSPPGHSFALPGAQGNATNLAHQSFPGTASGGSTANQPGPLPAARGDGLERPNHTAPPDAHAPAALGSLAQSGQSLGAGPSRTSAGGRQSSALTSSRPPVRDAPYPRFEPAGTQPTAIQPQVPGSTQPGGRSAPTAGRNPDEAVPQAGSSSSTGTASRSQIHYLGENGRMVTEYRHSSRQDRETMQLLGGYKRGEDTSGEKYLITPQGNAHLLLEGRGNKRGYPEDAKSALRGLRDAAAASSVSPATIRPLFEFHPNWLGQLSTNILDR
jgi:hypothetical protein